MALVEAAVAEALARLSPGQPQRTRKPLLDGPVTGVTVKSRNRVYLPLEEATDGEETGEATRKRRRKSGSSGGEEAPFPKA